MKRQGARNRILVLGVVMLLLAVIALPAMAEEVKGKWRFEVHIGGTDPGDSIPSDGGRIQVVDAEALNGQRKVHYFRDPRPGWMAGNEARISTDTYFEVRASYGIASWKNTELVLDMGIGYSTGSIDNIELAYSLDFDDPNMRNSSYAQVFSCETVAAWGRTPIPYSNCMPFAQAGYVNERWRGELISAGDLTLYPVSIGLYARFRPTKTFNPYIGLNVGYMFVDFDPSRHWRDVQDQLDASVVAYVERGTYGLTSRQLGGEPHDVKRPMIETPSTPYFELRGGTEWQFNPKAAVFVEMRYSWANKNIDITADGKHRFGTPLAEGRFDGDQSVAGPPGGRPAYIISGGREREVTRLDGTTWAGPHPGEYYFHGGTLDYGGWTFTAGIRFSL